MRSKHNGPPRPSAIAIVRLLLIGMVPVGCSSMSNGTATLQARGGITSDSEFEYYGSWNGYPTNGGFDLDVRSYGLRASLNSEYVDVLAGADQHRIDGEDVPEASVGLRKRFPSTDPGSFYVEAAYRRGYGFNTPSGRTSYDGMETGLGAVFQLSDHWFLDLCLCVEWTMGDLDRENGDDHLNEVVFNAGLGVLF
jgi:hypothetical protein